MEVEELIVELKDKLENIKHMLLMDKMCPGEIDYDEIINKKIQYNENSRRFMDIFGPHMALFHTLI